MTPNRTYGFILRVHETGYGDARISVATTYRDRHGNRLTPFHRGTQRDAELADFVVTADLNDASTHAWAFAYGYASPYHVDLRRAATMHRVLRTLERRLDQIDREQGDTGDFAEFLARIATTLGITTFETEAKPHEREITGQPTTARTLIELRAWIEVQERRFCRQQKDPT